MQTLLVVCVVATLAIPGPLQIEVERERGALRTSFILRQQLPPSIVEALPSGAQVRVTYELKIRARRRLWWDRRVWTGSAVSTTAFDPVTGRYRCELALDDVIVATTEVDSAEEARGWLTAPPPVRLVLPMTKRTLRLRIRARAVFSSTTKWLIFPSVEGTDWIEVSLGGEP
jgi:hypothetical protein